jgi:hypothetical protein
MALPRLPQWEKVGASTPPYETAALLRPTSLMKRFHVAGPQRPEQTTLHATLPPRQASPPPHLFPAVRLFRLYGFPRPASFPAEDA